MLFDLSSKTDLDFVDAQNDLVLEIGEPLLADAGNADLVKFAVTLCNVLLFQCAEVCGTCSEGLSDLEKAQTFDQV